MPLYLGNIVKQGSVGYTVVGSPTIVDGVASGFSGNDYLRINDYFYISPEDDLDIVIKANINTLGVQQSIFGYGPSNGVWGGSIYLSPNNNMLSVSGLGADLNVNAGPIQATGIYYIRLLKSQGVLKIGYSVDKTNWTYGPERTVTSYIGNTSYKPLFGRNNTSVFDVFQGSIDLNETYIKVNGDAWFGPCKMFDSGKYNFKF